METDPRWHHGRTLAAGQLAEFKVWAELVRQSLGGLHVFLPMREIGIDGVLHRLSDGTYIAVQVKARTELTPAGQVHIVVTARSLVDEATFRSLAVRDVVDGQEYLIAAFELHAGRGSRWAPHLVPRERLAERFGAMAPAATAGASELQGLEVDGGQVGFLGEAEVIRRLAESESLALFRPFPDLETVEVLARHRTSRRYLGLQVKTSGWDSGHTENRVHIRVSSFRPAPSTFICVLGWDRDTAQFSADCLLIPSAELAQVARVEGAWLVLELQPGSERHRVLDRYRTPLLSLGRTAESMLA